MVISRTISGIYKDTRAKEEFVEDALHTDIFANMNRRYIWICKWFYFKSKQYSMI